MYHDIDRRTGANISNMAHLKQSIEDILTTPLGSRLLRRAYGSELPFLVDKPTNPSTLVRLYAAVATAIRKHEPRFQITRVRVEAGPAPGQVNYALAGIAVFNGQAVRLDNLNIESRA